MKLGDIWKDGGEMSDYQAMSQYANEKGYMFARNKKGDFEIMRMPEFNNDEPVLATDPKDEKITALEQRLNELEAVLASLISPMQSEEPVMEQEPVEEEPTTVEESTETEQEPEAQEECAE